VLAHARKTVANAKIKKGRGLGYSIAEMKYLGKKVGQRLPIDTPEWQTVARDVNKKFNCGRDSNSVRRKYMALSCKTNHSSGDPEMDEVVAIMRAARRKVTEHCAIVVEDQRDENNRFAEDPPRRCGNAELEDREMEEDASWEDRKPSPLVKKGAGRRQHERRQRRHRNKAHAAKGMDMLQQMIDQDNTNSANMTSMLTTMMMMGMFHLMSSHGLIPAAAPAAQAQAAVQGGRPPAVPMPMFAQPVVPPPMAEAEVIDMEEDDEEEDEELQMREPMKKKTKSSQYARSHQCMML